MARLNPDKMPTEWTPELRAGLDRILLWAEVHPGVYCTQNLEAVLLGIGHRVVDDRPELAAELARARAAGDDASVDVVVWKINSPTYGYADDLEQIFASDTYRRASADPWVLAVYLVGKAETDKCGPYVGDKRDADLFCAFEWIRLRPLGPSGLHDDETSS
jgi:hypothetical protein